MDGDSSSSVSSLDSGVTEVSTPPVTYHGAPDFPPQTVEVEVAAMTVNEGGTGVHNGNLMNFTLNQFIGVVPVEGGQKQGKLDPKVMKDLVTDAAKINSETKKQFFSSGVHKLPDALTGTKEDMAKVQKRWCCWIIMITLLVSVIPLVSTAVYSMISPHQSLTYLPTPQFLPPVKEINSTESDEETEITNMAGSPRIYSRTAWVAEPPAGELDNNSLPIKTVIVCHTASTTCDDLGECALKIRYMQQYHMYSRKWLDIGYNFLIGGDGNVYEGRGWDKMGAHTKGHNNNSLGIAFVGTYIKVLPNADMLDAFNRLVNVGVQVGKISPDYSLVAQCQLTATKAPGLALARNMSAWPHYDSTLPVRCD